MKRSLFGIMLVAAAIWLSALPAYAAETPVAPGSGTLQAAINAANAGDTLLLQAGSYTGAVTVNKALTLRGAGSDSTTITAASTSTIKITTAAPVRIESLTVEDAKPAGTAGNAAVLVATGVSPKLYLKDSVVLARNFGINVPGGGVFPAAYLQNVVVELDNTKIWNPGFQSDFAHTTAIGSNARGIRMLDVGANSLLSVQNGSEIKGFGYSINISGQDDIVDNTGFTIAIDRSEIYGWNVLNIWGSYAQYNITNSKLLGVNTAPNAYDSYGVIVVEYDTNHQYGGHGNKFNISNTQIENYVNTANPLVVEHLFALQTADAVAQVVLTDVTFTDTTGNEETVFTSVSLSDEELTAFLFDKVTASNVVFQPLVGEALTLMPLVNPDALTLSGGDTLQEGSTLQLTVTPTPEYAEAACTWTSSDASVATVSETGLVTAQRAGSVIITATANHYAQNATPSSASVALVVSALPAAVPATGDSSIVLWWGLLASASAGAVLVRLRRKSTIH